MGDVKRFFSENSGRQCVYASDYDAAQSELAALREELAKVTEQSEWRREMAESNCKQHDAQLVVSHGLQQRLTAAEQRNLELTGLLRTHASHVATLADALFRSGACMVAGEFIDKTYAALEHQQLVNAALKPTESGASE